MMLLNCFTQYAATLENSAVVATGKGQFSFHSQRRSIPKTSNYYIIALISHANKVMHTSIWASRTENFQSLGFWALNQPDF